ncbi:hypothetical protein E2C01_050759 [Portunus trituberculatus]|uniref:Uncharacterized protein n=1 Tax=Portunus trituberculatus TaxID=210409 RepID=A0A5B7GCY4_PORTR|nr:hypothetical protein [Portunus trituberculatus]
MLGQTARRVTENQGSCHLFTGSNEYILFTYSFESYVYFKFRESKRDNRARATTKLQLSKQTLARQVYHGRPEQVGHAANTAPPFGSRGDPHQEGRHSSRRDLEVTSTNRGVQPKPEEFYVASSVGGRGAGFGVLSGGWLEEACTRDGTPRTARVLRAPPYLRLGGTTTTTIIISKRPGWLVPPPTRIQGLPAYSA